LAEASGKVKLQAAELEKLNAELTARLGELGVKKEEAEQANAAKTRFLAAASHDLRQPMHAISLLIGILGERMRDPEVRPLVDKVQMSVHAMENLFSSLLDISKLDAGAVRPEIGEFDVGGVLRLAELNCAPQARERGIELTVMPSTAVVRSDPLLLERIVTNLLANAIRYTEHGRVLAGCRRGKGTLRVLVIDTGIGIHAAHIDDIFEEFFQIANPERDRSKGLGLGLSIVKRSAALLGHPLIVRSEPGKGSVFGVELPLVERARTALPPAVQPSEVPAGLQNAFLLVIDDDRESRFAMETLCLQWGCHVVSAESAAEALEKLEHHLRSPDLIVCDYRLRDGQTGWSAVEAVRAQAEEAIPAIIVTGDLASVDSAQLQAGGAALLHKPVNALRLKATAATLLARVES
jgi:CheY-like chemotaxis protein/two-component sensor histidine kinase